MASMWDYFPGPAGLLDYAGDYWDRYKNQARQGLMEFSENPNLNAAALVGGLDPSGPLWRDAATQVGNLIAPVLNQQAESFNEARRAVLAKAGIESQGGLLSEEMTGKQLVGPLLMAGSVVRGRPGDLFKRMKAPDPEGALRRKLGRKEEVGAPQKRVVLEAGGKKMVVGDITFGDWKERVATMDPTDIEEYRKWYREGLSHFNRIYGKAQGEKSMLGWLLANQNESPSGALRNLLRAEDKTLGFPQPFTAGLGEEKVLQALGRGDIESGTGPKLMDFVDSAYERELRTFMGDRPEGGGPAVMDVHSTRDMGFVDDTFHKYLRRHFGDQADAVKVDVKKAVLDTQYERGSEKMNRFADEANQEGFMGGNWTPSEIQAVGWKFMGDEVGGGVQTIPEAVQSNIRRISTELAFAHGSPLDQKYGEVWGNMPYKDQAFLTDYVFRNTLPNLMADVGVRGDANLAGGKYLDDPWVPSIQLDALASPERAADMANMIGLGYQQDMVIRQRPLGSGDTSSVEVTLDGTPNMQQAMKFLESLKAELGVSATVGYYTPENHTMTLFLDRQLRPPTGEEKWAVIKEGSSKAVKLFSSRDKANDFLITRKDKGKLKIEHRPQKVSEVIESIDWLNDRIRSDLNRALYAAQDSTGVKPSNAHVFNSEAIWHGEFDHWKKGGTGAPFISDLREAGRSDLLARLDDYNQSVGQATETGIQILQSGQAKRLRRRPIRGPSLLTPYQEAAQPGGFLMPKGKGKTREEIEIQGGALTTKLNDQEVAEILDRHGMEWDYHENGGVTAIENFTEGGRLKSQRKHFKPGTTIRTLRNWLNY